MPHKSRQSEPNSVTKPLTSSGLTQPDTYAPLTLGSLNLLVELICDSLLTEWGDAHPKEGKRVLYRNPFPLFHDENISGPYLSDLLWHRTQTDLVTEEALSCPAACGHTNSAGTGPRYCWLPSVVGFRALESVFDAGGVKIASRFRRLNCCELHAAEVRARFANFTPETGDR
jgi:hypothetical protein